MVIFLISLKPKIMMVHVHTIKQLIQVMGTGTTAVACKELSINYIGSEISKNQCEWAENRLSKV